MELAAGVERVTVLVVDDDEAFRAGLVQWLGRHEFDCEVASDGAGAVEVLGRASVAAVVADIGMPGNEDLELVRTLAEGVDGPPVVLLTGQPTVSTAARAVGLGVAAYLTKPPDLDELLGVLRRAVAGYQQERLLMESLARLGEWERQLKGLVRGGGVGKGVGGSRAIAPYLTVTLGQVRRQLAILEQVLGAWQRSPGGGEAARELELLAAVGQTIEVIEQTKQNFKSERLASLRKRLQELLTPE